MATAPTNLDDHISELAALIGAVPSKFREAILVAALQSPGSHRFGDSWLIESLRGQLELCVLGWCGADGEFDRTGCFASIHAREVVSMVAASTAQESTELLTRQLVATIAAAVTPAPKASLK